MNDEVKIAYLKSHPLFAGVADEKIILASTFLKVKTVEPGEPLNYGEGIYSKVYLLIKGKIKITELDEINNELIKDILTAPDIFGDLSMEGNPSLDECAEVLSTNTVLCVMSTIHFKQLLFECPGMALTFANLMSNKLKKMETRHLDLVFRDAKSRLIRFMKSWALTDGNRIGNKIVLNNYLTHSDIAAVIATSRQSVNVLLNELRDAGLLIYNRKTIELVDPVNWK